MYIYNSEKHHDCQECLFCNLSYPLSGDIPDFIAPLIEQVTDPLIQRLNRANPRLFKLAAGLYEGSFWYPFVINLHVGKNTTSLPDLVQRVKSSLNIEQGRVLDTACGTATFGRRLASARISVFGIDAALAMLQKGAEYIRRDGVTNIHRTRVECLPFPDAFFDFAICSGALHLFRDPLVALQEISRTMKPGARLVGLTLYSIALFCWPAPSHPTPGSSKYRCTR